MTTTYNKYSVPPFSKRKDGSEYNGAGEGFEPCGICCRKTRSNRSTRAVVIDGGSSWGDEQSDQNDRGFMGTFPIGPDCHRQFRIN